MNARRMNIRTLIVAASVAALTGCAAYKMPTATPASATEMLEAAPVRCEGEASCAKAWRKAQVWIDDFSGWKIRMANDVIIETYGPNTNTLGWAFSARRTSNGDGSESIRLTPMCAWGGMRLCMPFGGNPTIAQASFAAYIR